MNFPDEIIIELNKLIEDKLNHIQLSSNKRLYPIFIIGAPRSGTTLIYQSLISHYDIGYPSNLIAKFWSNPLIGLSLQSSLISSWNYTSKFKSNHGYSKNSFLEPHEFGYFWQRWFDNTSSHYTPQNTAVSTKLKSTIYQLLTISNKPWVFKNLTLGLKIKVLKKVFPDSKFIIVVRNPEIIANSLLNGRICRYNTKKQWWSLVPKEIDIIKRMPPHEQVVAQVYYSYKQIFDDSKIIGRNNIKHIVFEDFCKNPENYLESKLHDFYLKTTNHIPSSFKTKTCNNHITKDDIKSIKNYIKHYNFRQIDKLFSNYISTS